MAFSNLLFDLPCKKPRKRILYFVNKSIDISSQIYCNLKSMLEIVILRLFNTARIREIKQKQPNKLIKTNRQHQRKFSIKRSWQKNLFFIPMHPGHNWIKLIRWRNEETFPFWFKLNCFSDGTAIWCQFLTKCNKIRWNRHHYCNGKFEFISLVKLMVFNFSFLEIQGWISWSYAFSIKVSSPGTVTDTYF